MRPLFAVQLTIFFLFIAFFVLALSMSNGFAQEKREPQVTVTSEFFQAPQKFDKVDRNANKILEDLEELIGPATPQDRFDVIVMAEKSIDEILGNLKSRHGEFSETFTYPSINGFAANLTKGQIIAFSQDLDIKQVEFDAPVYPHLDTSQQWFGTTKARSDFGVDGDKANNGAKTYSKDDIVVAVLDTGIDPNHVDLGPGKIIGWKDINNNQAGPYDETGACGGHGTHVSSMATGEGDGNANLKGVAPAAALVGIKVLSERFVQGAIRCTASLSEVVAGVQWMIDNKATYGIEVGNMSLGAAGCSDGTDSLSTIVNTAVDNGIVMTVSAGNEGPKPCSIGSPAAAEKAITVGAMADVTPGASFANACGDNDLPNAGFYLACFSSRGLTADGRIKPDIASPGVFIRAAKAGTTSDYIVYSGTSMSSPFTAGVAALMLDANSAQTPAQIKQKIGDTALDWGPAGKDVDYGSGRLQGYEAVKSAGSFSGTGPSVPAHFFNQGTITASDPQDIWSINVTDASLPLAITMIMPDWSGARNPDFDMQLRDPDGNLIATSLSATRQETIGVQPAKTGTYQLRVYRYAGSGSYFFDVSFGEAAVAISLTTDGTTPFGILPLGATRDTTPTGTNDVQTVQVDTGPANLSVRSTAFSDGADIWTLGATNGSNQVKWEFSKDAAAWNTFSSADTLFTLDNNVAQGATRDLYLRLTMPTSTASNNEHAGTVTIVASSP
ncbi:MAG: S8 family serine peptidase [Candidatus Levybacteria bacterium]|nr:S8 family serine peptidase [Candidatus Levybacteria bacterium]